MKSLPKVNGLLVECVLTVVCNYVAMLAFFTVATKTNVDFSAGAFAVGYFTAHNNANAIIKYKIDERLKRLERQVNDRRQ